MKNLFVGLGVSFLLSFIIIMGFRVGDAEPLEHVMILGLLTYLFLQAKEN